MKSKCAAKLLGTFALVFVGTGAVMVNDFSHGAVTLVGIALTFGLVVMAMIYSLGEVSGAHINPAVTVGLWLARALPAQFVLPYVQSQLAGAVLASSLLRLLFANNGMMLGGTVPSGTIWQSFILEIILTGFLMFVILCVTTGAKETGPLAGIVIGSVVAFDIIFGGPISSASMNPARSFGPALISRHLTYLWIYIAAPLIGSAIAVPCWLIVRSGKDAEPQNA